MRKSSESEPESSVDAFVGLLSGHLWPAGQEAEKDEPLGWLDCEAWNRLAVSAGPGQLGVKANLLTERWAEAVPSMPLDQEKALRLAIRAIAELSAAWKEERRNALRFRRDVEAEAEAEGRDPAFALSALEKLLDADRYATIRDCLLDLDGLAPWAVNAALDALLAASVPNEIRALGHRLEAIPSMLNNTLSSAREICKAIRELESLQAMRMRRLE